MENSILVENLWKEYKLSQPKKLTEALPLWWSGTRVKTFWALKNINIHIRPGENIGIIGPNGSGKSTLLKILTGVTPPTKGKYTIEGKITSLLELGTGFHPELSGRENIFLFGAVLGLTHKEITEKFADIISFSGIRKFLDTPVKHYSSGMYVRLAFSVATQLDSDVILIDEILSVGDAEFQQKSRKKLEEIISQGKRTLLMVSHNLSDIRYFCDRVYLIANGEIKEEGKAQRVTEIYLDETQKHSKKAAAQRKAMHIITGNTYRSAPLAKTEIFTDHKALDINHARMEHLQTLELPLSKKRVLDAGAGIGLLAQFFVNKQCPTVCIDARAENVNLLRQRFPHLKKSSFVMDLENESIFHLGNFDIIFAYGFFYHLKKPEAAIEKLAMVCKELFLIESCITDYPEPLNMWQEETYTYNQSLVGIGSRPTPSFIISALHQSGIPYVYFPKQVPRHPDFHFSYQGDLASMRNNHLLRQVFVASRQKLINKHLKLISAAADKK